ncbi:MAG: ATP-binding protein [Acidobacteriota bacterium]|nr:ATP-binding protein [Acidobacteriota bacterium]
MTPKPDDSALFEALSRVNNELATLHRDMAQKNVELAHLNQIKNRALGVAAHDLRNPLGVVLSYSAFLESEIGETLTIQQREFLVSIREASEFMLRMVTDLLDVSAIEAGELRLERAPTDLAALVRRTVSRNSIFAVRKRIAVEMALAPGLPPLSIDAGKIEQVMNNLIGNAVKFSHQNTRIDVSLNVGPAFVTVAVRDQGQGIPESDVPKLFKPFSRTSVRATGGEQSTGLGLAIVRNIIEGHGGQIRVESTVSKGSTFSFTLPMAGVWAEDMPNGTGPAAVRATPPAGARILVVDDNVVNRKVASLQLQKLGHLVDTVASGQDAIEAVRGHDYALILMDCEMPGMDGFQATGAIRHQEDTRRRTAIVALTASAQSSDRERCLAAGMDDYATKPLDGDVLRGLLARWIPPS